MPGYVIHVAVAQEYLKKHVEKKENYDEFVLGTISPDGVEDKSLTHYGSSSSSTNLRAYLNDKNPDNSYEKGYFFHLVVDYLFYNHYLTVRKSDYPNFAEILHRDYDYINDFLIKKYNVILPEKVVNRVSSAEGEPDIVKLDMVEKMIDEVSALDLDVLAVKLRIENKEKKDDEIILEERE